MPIQQMLLGVGVSPSLEHTVSDDDTNLNASTIFGSDYTVDIAKVIIIPSGYEIGATGGTGNRALTIPSGLVGSLEIQNAGTISGTGGSGGSAGTAGTGNPSCAYGSCNNYATQGTNGGDGGSAIYIASNNVTVTNSGTIRGGGGGGDGGSNGQTYTMHGTLYGALLVCIGGIGGAGGNGEGYNSAATNGAGGGSKTTNWVQYGGYFAYLGYSACQNFSNGNGGGNGGAFGQQGGNNGGAGGKYVELAGGISYTLSNSGTLTGNAP